MAVRQNHTRRRSTLSLVSKKMEDKLNSYLTWTCLNLYTLPCVLHPRFGNYIFSNAYILRNVAVLTLQTNGSSLHIVADRVEGFVAAEVCFWGRLRRVVRWAVRCSVRLVVMFVVVKTYISMRVVRRVGTNRGRQTGLCWEWLNGRVSTSYRPPGC